MISEAELAKLSYPNASKMVTEVPGPKVQKLLVESVEYESLTRDAGGFPLIADGNIFIDMSAGVAVNAVGRNHPKVLEAIRNQSAVIMHATDATNVKRKC